jgi:hypothetical protein
MLDSREEEVWEVHRLREEVKALKERKGKLKKTNMLGESLSEAAENLMKLLDEGYLSEPV